MTALATTLSHHEPTPRRERPAAARPGFTLVELMVVLIIVGMLIGLVTPAVMLALRKSRNAAIKAEIDMLHMAIMNYKNEYGSFPPCVIGTTVPSRPVKHLRRVFARLDDSTATAQLNLAAMGGPGDPTCKNSFLLKPETALVFWLEGYTNNPLSPLVPASQRKKLYDFDQSRKLNDGQNPAKFTGVYHASGNEAAAYCYLDCAAAPADLAATGFSLVVDVSGQPFNPDTFQIFCAGRDGIWGNGDDLSNFWPGTRQEYEDSLKQ